MNVEIKKVKCPSCGSVVPGSKFCCECGTPLTDAVEASAEEIAEQEAARQNPQPAQTFPTGFAYIPQGFVSGPIASPFSSVDSPNPNYQPPDAAPEQEAADDSGLTMLVDYCSKTLATVGGDGYDEVVLYRNDQTGELQIHTYSKYVYMPKEKHRSFKAKDGAAEAVFALIEELKLADYKDRRGFGLCGGMYVCKFLKDGEIIRITTDNLDGNPGILISVGNEISSYKGPQIFKQE